MKKYIVIQWPEIQDYMECKGFEDNAYLINDEKGLDTFGSSAYFVNEVWAENQEYLIKETKNRLAQEAVKMTINKILFAVSTILGITIAEIRNNRKNRKLIEAREMYAHFCREEGISTPVMGKAINRHHSTMINLIHQFENDSHLPFFLEKSREIEQFLNSMKNGTEQRAD